MSNAPLTPHCHGHSEPDVDQRWLDHAFAVGARVAGTTSPNPAVGCVIVVDNKIVGEGATQPPPGAHAEVMALQMAGQHARGATAYVTLEPCNHTGRTGPCTQALIDAGIARVVCALADPNEQASGGAERLHQAGIAVTNNAAPERAKRVHEIFLHTLNHARPFVIAKTAMSLDGFVADHTGVSQWITSPDLRGVGHRLRAEVDAIIVGSGTALADNPRLTVRTDNYTGPQPQRIILDRRGQVNPHTLTMGTDRYEAPWIVQHPTPHEVLTDIWEHNIHSVLLEGGPTVIGAFMEAGLIDRYEIHVGALVLGSGTPAVTGAFRLHTAPRFRIHNTMTISNGLVITAYPDRGA